MKKITDFNKKAFENYMAVYAVKDIRFNVLALVLVIADFFILLPSTSSPFQPIYVYILAPPIAFLNLWAIWISINPKKRQVQYTLFRGVFGIVCSLGLLIIAQKFAYGMLKLQTPLYFIFSFSSYSFALYYYYRSHIKKLQEPKKKSKSSTGIGAVGVASFVGLGQIVGNISIGFASQQMVAIVLMSFYSLFALALLHFIMELHRYYYLKQHLKDGGKTDRAY
ncbi:hypothetical protein [Priestia taiwanensis]|uniref:Uncharacterized protein n=1 Tax=Priestia taiwanensis TaxID=1347902 RepID=A0A917ALF4_9BACI|nr:hypothetical protein [Priestia taiwanensis]MBM7362120.1 hypothetical protein [Priestia taiwanensis]GGE59641.1 hypothetical protein GCM10007140_07440 [Priestia taiwanensis]